MSRTNYIDDIYENSSIEFEILINNLDEWGSNSIESSRQCFKHLYNIIRYQQKKIEIIDKQKISNKEISSAMNTKANIGDLMFSLNEISKKIEQCPTFEQVKLFLNEKISKKEVSELLKTKLSLEEIKECFKNGEIKINLQDILEDVNKNFFKYNNLNDIISSKMDKNEIISLLNLKANKIDIGQINNDLKNLKSLNSKIKEMNNNYDKMVNNIDQNIIDIQNDLNTNKIDNKKVISDITNQINNFDSKLNKDSNKINNTISDLEQKINIITNKYESLNEAIKMQDNNYAELLNIEKGKENKNSIYLENFDNKINSLYNDITKIYKILDDKLNKYEIDPLNLNLKELNSKIKIFYDEHKYTAQDIDKIYNLICEDIHQKFKDMENETKEFLTKLDNDIILSLDNKASKEEINGIQMDINKLKNLIDKQDKQDDLNKMNNIEDILNNINQNYICKKDYDNFVQICKNDIQEMKNDIILKSNIDETMSYLKSKADINDVNYALNHIQDELDNKLSLKDFNYAMNNQNKINSALLKSNQIGEWVWESGNLKNIHNVPWEIQKINNFPENFIWNENSDTIIVKQKGIYLLNLAIFVKNNAIIKIYVNGDMLLSKNNNEIISEKNERFKNANINSNSIDESINGININEPIFLQEKSRIFVSYYGGNNVKGIMMLKMLC